MKKLLYAFFGSFFLFASCKSIKMDTPETATKLAEFSKGACYGKCPVYKTTFFTDGSVVYSGKQNVERLGIYKSQLNKKEYKNLVNSLRSADLYKFEDEYNQDIADGAKTKISYFGENGTKTIATKFTMPGTLEPVLRNLEEISVSNRDWTAINVPKTKEDIVKEDKPTKRVFSYSQGACFGKCPVFSIEVLSDKSIILVGKRFAKNQGIFENKVSDNDYNRLMSLLSSDAFSKLEESYDKDIMDAQQFTFKYFNDENGIQTVKTKITQTSEIKEIVQLMQDLESSRGWKKKEGADATEIPENTLLVSLSPKVEAKKWIQTKRHLGAKIVRFLSPNGTYFIMSVDTEQDLDRVKEELRRDRDVLSVDNGNRPSKPRGTKPKSSKPNKHGKATIKKGGK